MIDVVNNKMGSNDELLESALQASLKQVTEKNESGMENMRGAGREFDQQVKAQIADMDASNKRHETLIQALHDKMVAGNFEGSAGLKRLEDAIGVQDVAAAAWKEEIEKFVVDSKAD